MLVSSVPLSLTTVRGLDRSRGAGRRFRPTVSILANRDRPVLLSRRRSQLDAQGCQSRTDNRREFGDGPKSGGKI